MGKTGFYIHTTLKKLMKSNFLILFFVGFGFSSNLVCENSEFDIIIQDIQKYGSKFKIIVGQDTVISSQILDKSDDILTINLLEEKWSNYNIRQNFSEEYSLGSSVPFEIPLNQIDCIEEIERPNIIKEYVYIGFTALIFWGLLSIFNLL